MKGAACNKSCIVQGLLLLLVPEPGDQLSSLRPKLPLVLQAHLIKVHWYGACASASCMSIHMQPGALLRATSHPGPRITR